MNSDRDAPSVSRVAPAIKALFGLRLSTVDVGLHLHANSLPAIGGIKTSLESVTHLRSARIRVMPDSKSRARKIKLLLFDVDGVLTDGKLFFFPSPAGAQQSIREQAAKHRGEGGFGLHSETFVEAKGFHAHDGAGISLARLGGLKTGLITKRISETVALRARDLKLDHVHQGINDKLGVFKEILKQEQLSASEACFVGDDVIDLPVMWNCGLAIAVANARSEVKRSAHYVTEHSGGDGAVRDAIEYILKAQGKWKEAMQRYIGERSPGSQ